MALGAALLMAGCAGPLRHRPVLSGWPDFDRRRDRCARLIREFGLPLSRRDPELSGDGQVAALPRRRRQRPAWPFEPARRNPLGGPDLQRSQRAARRAAIVRSRQARGHHRLLPRQQRHAVARRHRPAADRAPARQFGPQRRPGGAAARGGCADSSAGRFWSAGGFAAFLSEAQSKLGDLYPNARGAFGVCRSSSSPIAAAICRPPIRSPSAATGPCAWTRSARRALRRARQVGGLGGGAGTQRLLCQRLFDLIAGGQRRVRSELQAAGVTTVSGLPSRAHPGRCRLCRRRLRRPQRLRHLRVGRRALTRHLLPHRGVGTGGETCHSGSLCRGTSVLPRDGF